MVERKHCLLKGYIKHTVLGILHILVKILGEIRQNQKHFS